MIAYKKEDYVSMARARVTAFQRIARELGPEHAITKMMGTLSHGRHQCEHGTDFGLREAVEEKGFLDGFFNCLNLWARDNDGKAQRVMLNHYPSGYSTSELSTKTVKR
jgi:hypothetical protein